MDLKEKLKQNILLIQFFPLSICRLKLIDYGILKYVLDWLLTVHEITDTVKVTKSTITLC